MGRLELLLLASDNGILGKQPGVARKGKSLGWEIFSGMAKSTYPIGLIRRGKLTLKVIGL